MLPQAHVGEAGSVCISHREAEAIRSETRPLGVLTIILGNVAITDLER
jgi:hypothetical protein